jgi:hypothetical protein
VLTTGAAARPTWTEFINSLETASPGERNTALNAAAWTLGRWITVGTISAAS